MTTRIENRFGVDSLGYVNDVATPNTRLTEAMATAGLTLERLAELTGAATSSVHRWRSDASAVPRLSHRLAVAKVLEVPVRELWDLDGDGSVQLSSEREWPAVTAIPREVWADLFRTCSDRFDVCIGTSHYIATELGGLARLIAGAADAGDPVQVRILGADPAGAMAAARQANEAAHDPSITGDQATVIARGRQALDTWSEIFSNVPGAEVRTTDDPAIFFGTGIVRFDTRMIAYHYLSGIRSLDGPVELLNRADVGGRFDGLATHLDRMWETGLPYSS